MSLTKLYVIFIILMISMSGLYAADWVINGNYTTVTSTTLVGIGTTTPDTALRVWRTPGQGDAIIAITGGSCNTLWFSEGDTTNNIAQIKYDGTELRIGSGNADILNIKSGKVGIGTTSPQATLEVKATETAILATSNVSGGSTIIAQNNNANGYCINTYSTNGAWGIYSNTGKDYFSGKVAIGTTTPDKMLTVKHATGEFGIATTDGTVKVGMGSTSSNGAIGTFTAHPLNIYASNSVKMTILTDGKVGIGTTSPSDMLTVAGNVVSSGTLTSGSSRSLKKDIKDLSEDEALNALMKLKTVKFYYRADDRDQKLGFISEDVPDLVAEKDRKSLSSMDFAALAITVIQKQEKRIEVLEKELMELKGKK